MIEQIILFSYNQQWSSCYLVKVEGEFLWHYILRMICICIVEKNLLVDTKYVSQNAYKK